MTKYKTILGLLSIDLMRGVVNGIICVGTINPVCDPGQYIETDGSCVRCREGAYCGYNIQSSAFNTCPTYCPGGTYNPKRGSVSINDCLRCPNGTWSTSGLGTCLDVPIGKYPLITDSGPYSVNFCPSGTYRSTPGASSINDCIECPSNSITDGKTPCVACPDGYFADPFTKQKCFYCDAGTYYSTIDHPGYAVDGAIASMCYYSPENTYSFDGINVIKCPSGSFNNNYGGKSISDCQTCPNGQYPRAITMNTNDGSLSKTMYTCTACPANTYAKAGSSSCTKCPTGSFALPGSDDVTDCTTCTAGNYFNIALNKCTQCPAGTYSLDGAINIYGCYNCPINTYSGVGSTQCTQCPTGQTSVVGSGSCVSGCNAGSYYDLNIKACKLCNPGTFTNVTNLQNSCYKCPDGTASTTHGLTSCSICPKGTYSAITGMFTGYSSCNNCNRFQYAPAGSSKCFDCPAGTYYPMDNSFLLNDKLVNFFDQCPSCPIGQYQPLAKQYKCLDSPIGSFVNSNGATAAILCPVGTYSPTPGASSCLVCPIGTYSDVIGSSICKPSPVGAYVDTTGAVTAIQCPVGTFSPTSGASSCIQCPIGTYSDVIGASICKPSPAGTYVDTIGSSAFKYCYGGYYTTNTGTTSLSNCKPCPTGTYSMLPSGSCTPTDIGYFTNSVGSFVQTIAPAGTYVSTIGATTPIPCPAGTYGTTIGATSSSACNSCPLGSYQSLTGQSSCTPSPAGSFVNVIGAKTYSKCSINTYSTVIGATSLATCKQCKIGSYAAPGSTKCFTCPIGYVVKMDYTGCRKLARNLRGDEDVIFDDDVDE